MDFTRESFFTQALTVEAYVQLINKLPLRYEPGHRYHYSSLGFILLGAVAEKATGKSYEALIKDKIAVPLELKGTGYSHEPLYENYADDMRYEPGSLFSEGTFEKVFERELSTVFAAGGMYSSVNDLINWSIAIRTDTWLDDEFRQLLFTPVDRGYCYGLFKNPEEFLRDDIEAQLYFHGGQITGYRALHAMYDDGTTVIGLFNTSPLNGLVRFVNKIHMMIEGRSQKSRAFIHPSLRNRRRFEEEGGLTAFSAYHQKISKRAGYSIHPSEQTIGAVMEFYLKDEETEKLDEFLDTYIKTHEDLSENFINTIGYTYLEYNHNKKAISAFNINTKHFPNSPNLWDSLGDGYMMNEDYQKAADSYSKAVELGSEQSSANLDVFERNLKAARQATR